MRTIERAGGATEPRDRNLVDVLLPAELQKDGGPPLVTLAVETELLVQEPGAELATLGSPWMDALIVLAASRGMTAHGYVPCERIRKKGLREEVERTLVFLRCRLRHSPEEPEVLQSDYAQFNFKVTYLSDERRERMYVVPVNLWSNQVNLALAERLSALTIEESPATNYPEAPQVSLEDAYSVARAALRRLVSEEMLERQSRTRKRLNTEFMRVNRYYTEVLRELNRRRQRTEAQERLVTIAQKEEAIRMEGERKLRELAEKYQLRSHAQLTSARLLSQIKVFFNVLLDRGTLTRTLTLAFDPLLGRLEPPICESCHQETVRIQVAADGQLRCSACGMKE